MATYEERKLFGGAITVQAPRNLVDAALFRQVPDTQEVLIYPDSNASIIIEILERVEPSDPEKAAKFHFDSLAHDNDAKQYEVLSVNPVAHGRSDKTHSAIVLEGIQMIPKFNKTEADRVSVLLALYRIEDKKIDLVVSANIPTVAEDGGAVDEAGYESVKADFDTLVRSLCIVDFGLFA